MKFSSPKLDIFVKNFAPIGECVFFLLSCSNFLIFSTLSLWSIQGSWYITRRFNEKNDEKFAANDQSCGREISRNDWNGKYSKKCLLWTILFLLLTDLWHINQFLISSTLRWIFLVRVRDNVHSKSFTNFTSKKSTKKFSKKKIRVQTFTGKMVMVRVERVEGKCQFFFFFVALLSLTFFKGRWYLFCESESQHCIHFFFLRLLHLLH